MDVVEENQVSLRSSKGAVSAWQCGTRSLRGARTPLGHWGFPALGAARKKMEAQHVRKPKGDSRTTLRARGPPCPR